jgi:hypothetical protein
MGRRSLLEQVYVDVEAQFTGSPDCTPGRVGKQVVHEVFLLLRHKLGDAAARELFGEYGPRSKSEIITYKNWMLMRLYGQRESPVRPPSPGLRQTTIGGAPHLSAPALAPTTQTICCDI